MWDFSLGARSVHAWGLTLPYMEITAAMRGHVGSMTMRDK